MVSSGAAAGRDAWLSTMAGAVGGMLLFVMYWYPFSLFPELTLIGCARKLLGKGFGTAVGFLYSLLFLYDAARDMRDGVELTSINILDATPRTVIALLMTLCMMYVAGLGIEVLARTGVCFWFVLIPIIIGMNTLLFISGSLEFERLLPVLENGWRPVLESTLHETLLFPYGELLCMMMFMPFLQVKKKGVPPALLAIATGGFILAQAMVLNVASLGPEIVERSLFPLVNTLGKIQVSELFARMDLFVLAPMIVVDFFKVSLFFQAGLFGIADIFGIPYRKLILPIGCIVMLWSILSSSSFVQHMEYGTKTVDKIFPLFFVVIPLLLAVITFFHKRRVRIGGHHKADPQLE